MKRLKRIAWKLLPWAIIIPGFSAAMLCKFSVMQTALFALALGASIAILEAYVDHKTEK